ncbi:hypothetical protein FS935_23045 [Metabacillus litoralis]|uniref:Tetratricopeptide repeat protein n=1 Tax=Metabacillus litoralis TaxID=152268 RepID=A0A5C6US33_9BACI|nr:hypothetical protein [Metabacillus litoralis]TXC76142.1 hypothetical protein FS935_23045 [Metabacillus litoralis]
MLQAMILLSCPFFGVFIIYNMSRKMYSKNDLPDWLLRRVQFDDFVLKSPDIEEETDIIPFNDALILNDNKTKRKILIDLLKGEFLKNVDALELALQSDDSETSHYAATAVQQVKSDLMKTMRQLEEQLLYDGGDYDSLEAYRDLLKHYIRIEFLDKQTRKKYTYLYYQTLDKLIKISPASDELNFIEKIESAITLNEHQVALETAKQFLEVFPEKEDAYFSALNVHYSMRNSSEFKQVMNKLRSSDIKLSPDKLNQLRFWLQGDEYEQQL